jgi:hypothetical protein
MPQKFDLMHLLEENVLPERIFVGSYVIPHLFFKFLHLRKKISN